MIRKVLLCCCALLLLCSCAVQNEKDKASQGAVVMSEYSPCSDEANHAEQIPQELPDDPVASGTELIPDDCVETQCQYENYDPYPFDESISLIPEQNTALLVQEPWRLPLPEGYEFFDISMGDLNGDVLADTAVVIEQSPGMYSGSSTVIQYSPKALRVLFLQGGQRSGKN